MKPSEPIAVIIGIAVLVVLMEFSNIINFEFSSLLLAVIFAAVVILTNILAKKTMARAFDASAKIELWTWSRYGLRPDWKLPNKIPLGIILPLFVSVFTLGIVKVPTVLSYETTAHKGSKRVVRGYIFSAMTDWHIALVGAAGIATTLIVSFVSYWIPGFEPLFKIAAYYAFFNLIPFSKLDGAQIFFGSRVVWTALALIATIMAGYAIIL